VPLLFQRARRLGEEILEPDALAERVGEGSVRGPVEARVEVEAVADVADDEERRRVVHRRRVARGLAVRLVHAEVPLHGAAPGEALLGILRLRALLGLQDEAAVLVQVDLAGADLAVLQERGHVVLEDVAVPLRIAGLRLGPGHPEGVGQIVEEAVFVGALFGAALLPLGDEGLEVHAGPARV